MGTMIAAAITWETDPDATRARFESRYRAIVSECADRGASLVVFPECVTLELLAAHAELKADAIAEAISRFDFGGLVRELAQQHKIWLVGGTTLMRLGNQFVNAAPIGSPLGELLIQPKCVLTQYEKYEWKIAPGDHLLLFGDGKIGATICYDSEFPESGRALAEAGCVVQCVPAFTESMQGFQRVRWCCQARATENQVFVIHASLVGGLGREPLPSAYGSSAILCPSAEPFPESAVLAETATNLHGVCYAELCFDALDSCRAQNDVRNWEDRKQCGWRTVRA